MTFLASRVVALLIATGAAAGAFAQSSQSPWTFGRVLTASWASHPAVQGKRSEQAAARADKEGAEWARYPTPSVEASTGDSAQRNSVLRVDQPLWTGGRITAGIEAAGSRLDAAGAAVDEAQIDMALRVIAAYAEALRQKAKEQHAAKGVQEHERLLAMIKRRVAQEVSSQTDQRFAESRLFQATSDQTLTTQALKNALAQLAQLTGEPVADVSWQGIGEEGAPASLEAALQTALAASPSLKRLAHEEAAAAADVESKRAVYMPQVVLRLERQTGTSVVAADSRAMVVLVAQPGAGLSSASGVDAAVARREATRLARETAERSLRERVTLDWNEWSAAKLRRDAAAKSSEISDEVFESYTRQYVAGRKTWIDVLNAAREATQAQFLYEDARAQAAAAALRLKALARTLKVE